MQTNYILSPTQYVDVDGISIAYRRIGLAGSPPIIYINHLAANLDGCDPMIMDALAKQFTVISFDYPGIGSSGGKTAVSVDIMAKETINFIQVLNYKKVHLLGLSLGGFVAQAILKIAPHLIGRVILAGTGPAGDKAILQVPRITFFDMLRGFMTGKDPRYYLFFPTMKKARLQAMAFLARTQQRKDRDKPTTFLTLIRQLKSVVAWAKSDPQDLASITHRIWVVNGNDDRMVPTSGSYELARCLPNANLTIYKNAGHGSIFQNADLFAQQAIAFYKDNDDIFANTKL